MKKTILTIAIVLGLGLTTFADPNHGGGLFQRGVADEEYYGMSGYNRTGSTLPMLPNHNLVGSQNAPLGSGITVLLGLGAAYLIRKKGITRNNQFTTKKEA